MNRRYVKFSPPYDFYMCFMKDTKWDLKPKGNLEDSGSKSFSWFSK